MDTPPQDHLADRFEGFDKTDTIEWMIETSGWAYEAVSAVAATDPPSPAYGYTIGLGDLVDFPDVAVFGLTPAAGHGLVQMVVGLLLGGTEVPIGPELVGVLDGDLRCRFVPLDVAVVKRWMPTAVTWYSGEARPAVQMLYPDRAGSMPYEPSFDRRLRFAQPVLGSLAD